MKIKRTDVLGLVNSIPNGVFFSVRFKKKDGTIRNATAQKGVYNTKDPDKRPKGTGASCKDKLKGGVLGFYEPHHQNEDGTTTGEWRSCKIERIISIKTNKEIFEVED